MANKTLRKKDIIPPTPDLDNIKIPNNIKESLSDWNKTNDHLFRYIYKSAYLDGWGKAIDWVMKEKL